MEQQLRGTSFRGRISQSRACSPALAGPGLTAARLRASAEKDCKCSCRKKAYPSRHWGLPPRDKDT